MVKMHKIINSNLLDVDERKNQISWLLHIAHNIYGYSTAITFFYHNLMEYILLPCHDYNNIELKIALLLKYLSQKNVPKVMTPAK